MKKSIVGFAAHPDDLEFTCSPAHLLRIDSFPVPPYNFALSRTTMPTYDYGCRECGHQFELFEGIRNDGPKRCPACGRKGARRLIGKGAGLIFKGSGFYATDYGRGGSNGGRQSSAAAEGRREREEERGV